MAHVLVICARRYNGHELWTALGVLQNTGHTFEVVSTDYYIEDEVTGQPNVLERKLDDLSSRMPNLFGEDFFDALMVVSGNMADTEAYWDDPLVQGIVLLADAKDVPIAAICCSVPTIAKIAKGKKVSFYPLIRSRTRLAQHGAILQTVACTVDGKLVTAEHQMASQIWAEAFSRVLNGEQVDLGLQDSGYSPPGRPAKPVPGQENAQAAMGHVNDMYVSSGLTEDAIVKYAHKTRKSISVHFHSRADSCNDDCYLYQL